MQKEIMLQQLEQSKMYCFGIVKKIDTENAFFRLSESTATAGFIYRHIGESTHVLAQLFGYKTDVEGTTMGQPDTGKEYDLKTSLDIFEQGYHTLGKLVNETSGNDWLEEIEADSFGKISRIKLYSFTLFHIAHHCGQIGSAIAKGRKF